MKISGETVNDTRRRSVVMVAVAVAVGVVRVGEHIGCGLFVVFSGNKFVSAVC